MNTEVFIGGHREQGRVINEVGRTTVNLTRHTHGFAFRGVKFHKPGVAPLGNTVNIGLKSRYVGVVKDFFVDNTVVSKKANRRRDAGGEIININKK